MSVDDHILCIYRCVIHKCNDMARIPKLESVRMSSPRKVKNNRHTLHHHIFAAFAQNHPTLTSVDVDLNEDIFRWYHVDSLPLLTEAGCTARNMDIVTRPLMDGKL